MHGKQGPVPKEISQTLLTNKKQGKLDLVHAPNIIMSTRTSINREKYTFCVVKSLEHLKDLKTGRVPYLGLELIMHIIKSQIHLVRRSL
jgi:hypothetical protein